MEKRPLGSQGLLVSAQGLGCMGMTAFYIADPAAHEAEALRTLDRALELGVTFLDTAWIYQHPSGAKNEELVGKAIAKHGRDKFIIATKFGIDYSAPRPLDSTRITIRKQLQESLSRLGVDYIDLYYQHRQDPETPVEEVMRSLKELVSEGKIRYIGLSEVTADELRRAHAIHPVTAIQMEWSLQTRDIEAEIVPAARELGVGIVAYSPLGRGLLTPRFATKDAFEENDWRAKLPRVENEENYKRNVESAARLAEIAKRHGVTAAQLALAWVHSRGADVFPIPGTKSPARLEENAAAFELSKRLTAADLAEIEAAVPPGVGDRYPGMQGTWNAREAAAGKTDAAGAHTL